MKFRLYNSRLGHTDTILCEIDGGARGKFMVAGSEGIALLFLPLKAGVSKRFRVFEKHPKSLGEPVVLLNQRLIVHLF